MSIRILFLFFLCTLTACSRKNAQPKKHQQAGFIERQQGEFRWSPTPPKKKSLPQYPWEIGEHSPHTRITKDYFRCNGSALNPPRQQGNTRLDDCGGFNSHSLPIHDGKEFIYPILIELLNHLQEVTQHKVVITCGHRCPKHHFYARIGGQSRYSKHMMGAEVAFYVAGMEDQPEKIVELLQKFYAQESSEYTNFQRYTKKDTDVTTLPWYNKEVFIKLYRADEGRDFDNRHPYPYIRIQVRYDRSHEKRVIFNWDRAEKNTLIH